MACSDATTEATLDSSVCSRAITAGAFVQFGLGAAPATPAEPTASDPASTNAPTTFFTI